MSTTVEPVLHSFSPSTTETSGAPSSVPMLAVVTGQSTVSAGNDQQAQPDFVHGYLAGVSAIADQLAQAASVRVIEQMVELLARLRAHGGRLFFVGVGGSAANASHAVNDFRKIAAIESYAPSDHVAELTARINDEGWQSSYAEWLCGSRLSARDAIFVFSVGGGSLEPVVSANLVECLRLARRVGAKILGVVGRDGGATAQMADCCLVIPTLDPALVTPHAEEFQAVLLHLLVSHPRLKTLPTRWESLVASTNDAAQNADRASLRDISPGSLR